MNLHVCGGVGGIGVLERQSGGEGSTSLGKIPTESSSTEKP